MAKKDMTTTLYIIIIILLAIVILLFLFRAYTHFTQLRAHRQYFRHPNAEIQSWMSIPTIVREFNISESDIYSQLNITKKLTTGRVTLLQLCKENHLNCTEEVAQLNALVQND